MYIYINVKSVIIFLSFWCEEETILRIFYSGFDDNNLDIAQNLCHAKLFPLKQ